MCIVNVRVMRVFMCVVCVRVVLCLTPEIWSWGSGRLFRNSM